MAKQVAVIGAGPAGLMAAETLAAAGHRVTVYDQMPSPARKLLIAGRGGLNLTHSEPLETFLPRYGAAAEWLEPSIRAFPPQALRDWCHGLGEETFVGSSGRVFPKRMKAVQLLRAWLQRLEQQGVQYRPRHRWLGWGGAALRFATPGGEVRVDAEATVLALGGASWPRLGSDGGWVRILQAEGVEVAPLVPSNCGFTVAWSAHFKERFAGTPLKPVSVTHGDTTRQGEAMVTAQGIEGGVIYALSAALRDRIYHEAQAEVQLDLRPAVPLATLVAKFHAQPRANKSLSTWLGRHGFSPVAISLLREVTAAEWLADASPSALAARLKTLPLTLTGTTGMARAISSAGGIPRAALTPDFMLRARPGVWAVGEMLDWEAPTGGYLLQACFSTAVAAARAI